MRASQFPTGCALLSSKVSQQIIVAQLLVKQKQRHNKFIKMCMMFLEGHW